MAFLSLPCTPSPFWSVWKHLLGSGSGIRDLTVSAPQNYVLQQLSQSKQLISAQEWSSWFRTLSNVLDCRKALALTLGKYLRICVSFPLCRHSCPLRSVPCLLRSFKIAVL